MVQAPTAAPPRGMPVRHDRVMRYVTAFCPQCHAEEPSRPLDRVERLGGYLTESEGSVWLVRGCQKHGRIVSMYDESAEIERYLEEWTAPTKVHTPDTRGNYDPVPSAYLRGLGELQTQHTCILLEDITSRCNLQCPTCFADSSPDIAGFVPVDEVLANVDQRLAREHGRIDVLMLSGGEPTIHPDFTEILERLLERDIVRVLINTNGISVAKDDEFLKLLETHRHRAEVYLQYDGLRLDTHKHHRGADLRRIKADAVQRLSQAGVFTTLTMVAALDINDDEIGDVVMKAIETPFVGGVSIQPQFASGRSGHIEPLRRLTHTGVLKRLSPQTRGLISWKDLTALPCSHPHCCSVGYMIKTDTGEWKSLTKLVGHDVLKQHLELVANRINDPELSAQLRALVRDSLLGLLSEQSSLTHPSIATLLQNVCEACDLGASSLARIAGQAVLGGPESIRKLVAERVKRITVKPFMDMHTMIEERLLQCCVHVGTENGDAHQCAPFCAVQAWAPLGAQKVAEASRRRLAELGALA